MLFPLSIMGPCCGCVYVLKNELTVAKQMKPIAVYFQQFITSLLVFGRDNIFSLLGQHLFIVVWVFWLKQLLMCMGISGICLHGFLILLCSTFMFFFYSLLGLLPDRSWITHSACLMCRLARSVEICGRCAHLFQCDPQLPIAPFSVSFLCLEKHNCFLTWWVCLKSTGLHSF